jgi:hypothetical protein
MREAIPRQTLTLAATLQGVQPVPHRLCAECCDLVHVARNGVVIAIPTDHSPQPRALLADRLMTLREQRPLHRLQLGPEPLTRCPPPHEEPSALVRHATDVSEAQKVEGLRSAFPALLSVAGGEPPKLDQSRFVGVQSQTESGETFPKLLQEPFGLAAMLETNDEIVSVTHDDDIARGELRPPPVDPQVEDIMVVQIGQEG